MFYPWMLVICCLVGYGNLIKMLVIIERATRTLLRIKAITILWLLYLVVKSSLVLKQMGRGHISEKTLFFSET